MILSNVDLSVSGRVALHKPAATNKEMESNAFKCHAVDKSRAPFYHNALPSCQGYMAVEEAVLSFPTVLILHAASSLEKVVEQPPSDHVMGSVA
jgi:hypothetical protein